jgi:2-aminomuconate deaminase
MAKKKPCTVEAPSILHDPIKFTTMSQNTPAPKPVGLYPLTRRVGDLLFLSGVGPRIPGSGEHDEGVPGLKHDHNGNFAQFDFEAQAKGVFSNVRAILESEGARWEDLVDITVFLTDMQRDFTTFNRVYKAHFEHIEPALRPCRTTMEVGALPTPIAIELKCIAHCPE